MARNQSDDNEDLDSPEMRFQRERIRQFLFELRNALGLTEGGPQKLEDLEEITGRPHGTIGSWYEGSPMQQVEFILSLLERMPRSVRHQLVDRACRIHPTTLHPHLAHDPLTLLRLERIIRQPNGLTIIRGQEFAKGFVLAAMGNSIRNMRRGQVQVYGLDTQVRPWRHPRGVTNLAPCRDGDLLKRKVAQLRQAPDGSLILLSGDWWKLNGLGDEVGQLAVRHNVIATEAPIFHSPIKLRPRPSSIQLLTVARVPESPDWLQIMFSIA